MANLIIQAVEIKLGQEYIEDTSIGLYTISSLSYLRWSEATLTGVSETWKTGILLKNGIGDITESSNLERGGNIAEYSGLNVGVANAESIMQSLKDLQINLIGLSATVTEFIGTIGDSDATIRTIIFTGIVENILWGDTELVISFKNSLYKRETNLSITNENDVTTPVCFGQLTPTSSSVIENIAKFVRKIDSYDETVYTNEYFTGTNPEIKIFPVDNLTSAIDILIFSNGNTLRNETLRPDNCYMLVKDGTGEGQIRKVSYIVTSGINNTIACQIDSVFYTTLSSTNDNTRSWVQLIAIDREYTCDSWPCKSFTNIYGTEINTPQLHIYEDNKFNRISDYSFSVDSTDNNNLIIDGQQYSEETGIQSIDSVKSFIILSATSLEKETASTLDSYPIGGKEKVEDGLYANNASNFSSRVHVDSNTLTNAAKAYDKDPTTYADYNSKFSEIDVQETFWKVLKFGLPAIPKNVSINKIYLGIHAHANSPANAYNISFQFKRFLFTKTTDECFSILTGDVANIDDLPDFYYETNKPSTNNIHFYKQVNSRPDYNGYTLFPLSGVSAEEYETYLNGALIFSSTLAYLPYGYREDSIHIHDIAIIFELNSSTISENIYAPIKGRIYNDTWGSRKTAANLIEYPHDIIEHCKRLQNWSEIQAFTIADWGHEYAADSLIKTGATEGSFDNSYITTLTNQECAFQITDKDKATTTAITKKICDTFGLCSYINSDGYECIATLELIAPSESITLADCIGGIGNVIEPKVENIFCELVINYQYNQCSEKYDKSLKVTNIDATAWQSSYTPGYEDADGEVVWNTCKALYDKYRQVEQCPQDFSDQYCISDYDTAVLCAKRKIAWMDRARLPTIQVAYSKGKDYNIYKHLMIQLPTHTNNVSVECIIEKIVKSKSKGIVSINCVILGNVENAWYDTSDSSAEKQDTPDTGDEIYDQ